jgi:hypothetical protein
MKRYPKWHSKCAVKLIVAVEIKRRIYHSSKCSGVAFQLTSRGARRRSELERVLSLLKLPSGSFF